MKIKLATLLFVFAASVTHADQAIDLTGASADSFKSNLGRVVSLRGRLEEAGMQGPYLIGATPTNVAFYVIAEIPKSGSYSYPKIWDELEYQQVRLTGKLKFRSFDRKNAHPFDQIPPDYYYMVAQETTIEPLKKK